MKAISYPTSCFFDAFYKGTAYAVNHIRESTIEMAYCMAFISYMTVVISQLNSFSHI